MQYRKYKSAVKMGVLITVAQSLFLACSTTNKKAETDSDSVNNYTYNVEEHHQYDGREPASMNGGFVWLDEVGEDFNRIASDTSNRTVASEQEREILIRQKNWTFSFLPKKNHFFVGIRGENYSMIQTSIGTGENYTFVAEGQADNPVTLSFTRGEGRKVASVEECNAELSYWNTEAHKYEKSNYQISGKPCAHLLAKLKDYVP